MTPEQANGELVRLIRTNQRVYVDAGSVTEVDEANMTCTVKPADGRALLYGVRLRAAIDDSDLGVVAIPAKGSSVVVAYLLGDDARPVVVATSDVERVVIRCQGEASIEVASDGKVILNGGDHGGLVKIQELVTNLNRNVAMLSAMKTAFSSWSPVPTDGGAALKAVMTAALAGKNPGSFSAIENNRVTHG